MIVWALAVIAGSAFVMYLVNERRAAQIVRRQERSAILRMEIENAKALKDLEEGGTCSRCMRPFASDTKAPQRRANGLGLAH